MEPEVKDTAVKTEGTQPVPEKDNRGVSWENRAKEMERKYAELHAKVEAMNQPKPNPDDPAKQKERVIMEFVEDPHGFVDREIQKRKHSEELPEAESWLRSQPHYASTDDARIGEIIRENQLLHPSPKMRAKAAYNILKAEKLEREFADKKRESDVTKSSPDGSARSAPVKTEVTRRDLIKQLDLAQRRGDSNESYRILSKLEDVRG